MRFPDGFLCFFRVCFDFVVTRCDLAENVPSVIIKIIYARNVNKLFIYNELMTRRNRSFLVKNQMPPQTARPAEGACTLFILSAGLSKVVLSLIVLSSTTSEAAALLKKTNNNIVGSVWPKMAETCVVILVALIFTINVASAASSQVTFVGFLNDRENAAFSALLEVDTPHNSGLWLASTVPDKCSGDAVYGLAKAEAEAGQSSKKATVLLMLPVQHGHESRTLYLCHKSLGGHNWRSLGRESEFHMPKVTVNEVLNQNTQEEYILETVDDEDNGKITGYSGFLKKQALIFYCSN